MNLPLDSANIGRPKRVLVETWGCQMNVADSEEMLGILQQKSFLPTTDAADADLVLLNTCHIREKAKHKVLSRLGELRLLKEKNPRLKIAVSGCVAQAEGKRLLKQAPQIDILLGPGQISKLSTLLDDHDFHGTQQTALGFSRLDRQHEVVTPQITKPTLAGFNTFSRYVNIAQGCDNYCTFCVVPLTRGSEVSKMPGDVVRESEQLVAAGACEITLLGQNVNSYGNDLLRDQLIGASTTATPFVNLLSQVADIPGLQRLRFTTSNPHDFSRDLVELFVSEPKMGRYIHLPVQSGNDEILAAMKRKVTVAEYLEKIQWLRSIDPDFAISTDLIVGFPGETDEQFQGTIDLVKTCRFSFIYAFMYSQRKNTVATRLAGQVEENIKQIRLRELNRIQDVITQQWGESEVGKEREVLVLYPSQKREHHYYGRTKEFRLVLVESPSNIVGKLLNVRIAAYAKTTLSGELI